LNSLHDSTVSYDTVVQTNLQKLRYWTVSLNMKLPSILENLYLYLLIQRTWFVFHGSIENNVVAIQNYDYYNLTTQDQIHFGVQGHVVLRKLLPYLHELRPNILEARDASDLLFYEYALKSMGCSNMIESESDRTVRKYKKLMQKCKRNNKDALFPYYQNVNVHRLDEELYQLATSEYLGQLAASLLQVQSVRLYQTALFFKDPSGVNQQTGWHQDLNQVPVDTRHYVTFWCPLSPLQLQDSVLIFASKSHRDMSFANWYTSVPRDLGALLEERYETEHYAPFQAGDCSAHSGWVFHRALPNKGSKAREAIAFSFVDANARKLHSNEIRNSRPLENEDILSWRDWHDSVPEYGVIDSPFLPVVYTAPAEPPPKPYKSKQKKKGDEVLYYTTSIDGEIEENLDDLEWQAILDEDEDWWTSDDEAFFFLKQKSD